MPRVSARRISGNAVWLKAVATPSKRKIASLACAESDLLELFDDMRENAEREWESGTGLTITGPKPEWAEVDRALTRFKSLVPHKRF